MARVLIVGAVLTCFAVLALLLVGLLMAGRSEDD